MEGKIKVICHRPPKLINILKSLGISKSKIGAEIKNFVLVNTTSRNPLSVFTFMGAEVCPPPFANDNNRLGASGLDFEIKVGRIDTGGGTLSLLSPTKRTAVPMHVKLEPCLYGGGTRRHRVHGHLQGFECLCRDGVPPVYNIGTKIRIGVDVGTVRV